MRIGCLFVVLWLAAFAQLGAQAGRGQDAYGARGLGMTKMLLEGLSLPEWCWGGVHEYAEVERNFRTVSGRLLDSYFGDLSASGVRDPQGLLGAEERKVVEEVLAQHAEVSRFSQLVNVLSAGQELGLSEGDLRERLARQLEGRNVIVIVYFHGKARDAKGYVWLANQGFVENWEVDELFLKSARAASEYVGDGSELESYVKDVAKRSFWIEQQLLPHIVEEKEEEQSEKVEVSESEGLGEVLWGWILGNTLTLVLCFWVLAAGCWYFLWSRKWRKYVLPSGEVPVRLGAEHGAQLSDVVEYHDPKISLTEQYTRAKEREL